MDRPLQATFGQAGQAEDRGSDTPVKVIAAVSKALKRFDPFAVLGTPSLNGLSSCVDYRIDSSGELIVVTFVADEVASAQRALALTEDDAVAAHP